MIDNFTIWSISESKRNAPDVSINESISDEKIASILDKFWNSKQRSEWLTFDGMKIYVRRSHRYYDGKMYSDVFDIATVELTKFDQAAYDAGKRGGKFKQIFNVILSKYDVIFVENVINPDFYKFWERQPNFKKFKPGDENDISFMYVKNVTDK